MSRSASGSASASTDLGTNAGSPDAVQEMGEVGVRVRFFGGINVGAKHSTVCSSAVGSSAIDLEPNDLSGRSTPSTISFCDSLRLIGDVADDQLATSPQTTLSILPLLLLLEACPEKFTASEMCKRFGPVLGSTKPFTTGEGNAKGISLRFANQDYMLNPSQIFAHYLGRLAAFAAEGRRHKLDKGEEEIEVAAGQFCLSFPEVLMAHSDRIGKVISKGCRTGALNADAAMYCGQMTATVACWVVKHLVNTYTTLKPEGPLYVGFFSCGFSETSVGLLKVVPKNTEKDKLTVQDFELSIPVQEVLDIGVFDVLKNFCSYIESTAMEKDPSIERPFSRLLEDNDKINKRQRRFGYRLLASTEKLMKELGGLNTTSFSANIGNQDGADTVFDVRREEFEARLEEILICKLKPWLDECLTKMTDAMGEKGNYVGCEIVGGGCRIPRVAQAVEDAFKSKEELVGSTTTLRRTLDGTAAASMGCTALAGGLIPMLDGVHKLPGSTECWTDDDERRRFMNTERELRSIEEAERKRLDAMNKLESKVMEIEGLIRAEVAGASNLQPLVDGINDWLYVLDEGAGKVTTEKYHEEFEKLRIAAESHCAKHFEQIEATRIAQERKLEENAARVEAENAGKEKDDHDTRHLPNSQRLQKARKNKDEGNELLKGDSLVLAVERYRKAIQHLSKMFDCSPDEQDERKSLQIACHLNIAQAYLKEGSVAAADKAVQSCTKALDLEENNAKALFRRASAYERLKDMEAARKDLQKIIDSETVPDPAVAKCWERVDKAIKAEEDKAKRMYGRMFG